MLAVLNASDGNVVMGQRGHTSAGCLHVFQLIWEPQDGLIIPFTLFGQEMKKRRALADGFCVSQLEKEKKEEFFHPSFSCQIHNSASKERAPTDLHQSGAPDQLNEHNAAFLHLTCF